MSHISEKLCSHNYNVNFKTIFITLGKIHNSEDYPLKKKNLTTLLSFHWQHNTEMYLMMGMDF